MTCSQPSTISQLQEMDLPDHSTMNSHGEFDVGTPSTREICLPQWETKTIEVVGVDVGNVNDSRKTRG
jgi:hypothetical protein